MRKRFEPVLFSTTVKMRLSSPWSSAGFEAVRISMRAGEVATTAIPLDLRQLAIRQDGRWLWEALPLRLEAARWSGDPLAAVWSGTVESPLS